MLGAIDGEATRSARHHGTDARVDAVATVEPEGRRAGPAHDGVLPVRGDAPRVGLRVVRAGGEFVADLRGAAVFDARLPMEVSGEARDAAAALDEAVDRLAHLPGPVFVVPDHDDAAVAVEQGRIGVQVEAGGVVEGDALAFRPVREGAFIDGPAGVRVPAAVAAGERELQRRIARYRTRRHQLRMRLARRADGEIGLPSR